MNSKVDDAKEKGESNAQAAPFNIVKYTGSGDSAMDPRTWTAMGDKYYRNAYFEFKKLKKEDIKALGLHEKALRLLNMMHGIIPSTASEGDATLMSGSTFRKVGDLSASLKKMDPDKAAEKLYFSAFANTNYARMAKFLNTQDIAASFGTGIEGDKPDSGSAEKAEDMIKRLHSDMVDHLVKQRSKYINPKSMFLGYFDIKKKPTSADAKKVKEAYFTKVGKGKDAEYVPKFDTYEFSDSFGLFL